MPLNPDILHRYEDKHKYFTRPYLDNLAQKWPWTPNTGVNLNPRFGLHHTSEITPLPKPPATNQPTTAGAAAVAAAAIGAGASVASSGIGAAFDFAKAWQNRHQQQQQFEQGLTFQKQAHADSLNQFQSSLAQNSHQFSAQLQQSDRQFDRIAKGYEEIGLPVGQQLGSNLYGFGRSTGISRGLSPRGRFSG